MELCYTSDKVYFSYLFQSHPELELVQEERESMRSRSPMRSKSRSPRSSREPPSYSRFQNQPQYRPRFGEFREGREQYYHQDSKQDRKRSQKIGGASPAQSPGHSLDKARNRDTDFHDNELHVQLRKENERYEYRLPESPKMLGDADRKSSETIQMEKIMGFSSFHESRDKYFDKQSTVGSAKAAFSPSIKEEKIESPEVKQVFKVAERDFDQILDFVNKIEYTDDKDIKPKLEIKEQKTDSPGFKIEIKKEIKEEPLDVKEETDDDMKIGLAILDTLDFETRGGAENGQFDDEKELDNGSNKQHKCTICEQAFGQKGQMKHHVISVHVHNMRIHKCSLCDEEFKRKRNIKHHIANVHEGKGKQMYKCSSCEKAFSKISEMNIHIANVHERIGPLKCPLCEDIFPHKSHLIKHIVYVHEEKRR